MAVLYQLEGLDVVRVYELQPGATMLGRDLSNDIVLPEPSVSRFHCRIQWNHATAAWIEDLRTRNGTFVAGRPIARRHELSSGIRLQIGGMTFVYWEQQDGDGAQEPTKQGMPPRDDAPVKEVPPAVTRPSLECYQIRAWWWFSWNGFCLGWRIRRR